MITSSTSIIRIVLCGIVISMAPGLADAQTPQKARSLAATAWLGTENAFRQNGKLGFAFRADGTAFMLDEASRDNDPSTFVKGTWFQNGSKVVIRFGDCVYTGTINGNVLSGTGQNTNRQGSWTFTVLLLPKQNLLRI